MKTRMEMLINHKSVLQSQIDKLIDHMEKLDAKIQYYQTEINNQDL